MAIKTPHVDAVIVGFGWTGAILRKELTEAGLNVVALERGEYRNTHPEGAYPNTIDGLTHNIRKKLFLDLSKTTVSIRHGVNDTALPYRQLAAFLPGVDCIDSVTVATIKMSIRGPDHVREPLSLARHGFDGCEIILSPVRSGRVVSSGSVRPAMAVRHCT